LTSLLVVVTVMFIAVVPFGVSFVRYARIIA